jgi:hypothetical protein
MSSGRIVTPKLAKPQPIFVTPRPQIWPSMTHMGHMMAPKPLIIII